MDFPAQSIWDHVCCLIEPPCPLTAGTALLFKLIFIDLCPVMSVIRLAKTLGKVSAGEE